MTKTKDKRHLDPLHVIFGAQPVIARSAAEPESEKQPDDGDIQREAVLFGDLPQAPPGQRPSDKAALEQHQHELEQLPETGFEPPSWPIGR